MRKFLNVIIITMLLFSCKTKHTNVVKKTQTNVNCYEYLNLETSNEKFDLVTIDITLNSIQIGNDTFKIFQTKKIVIDDQSELLIFSDSFAFKFFRTKAIEYKRRINMVRYDFFIKNENCWELSQTTSFGEFKVGWAIGQFSYGHPDTEDFIIVDWEAKRIL